MATNNLNGINWAMIADKSLDFLGHSFFPLKAVARDFSDDIKTKGETVTTRIITGYTAQDLSGGYATNAQNSVSTAVTVTLNQFKGVPIEFKDIEIAKAGNLEWLRDQFVGPAINALVDDMMQDIFGVCLTAAFPNELDTTPANFDSDDLADIRGALTKLKVPRTERYAILHPDFYTNLIKDARIEDQSASGSTDALIEGQVQRIRGFNVFEYDNIPALSAENFRGMCLHPSAIAMAARTLADPTESDLNAPVMVENRVDPATGLPLQFRAWYSPDDGKAYYSIASLWGVIKAQANAMHRLVDNS